MKSKPLLFAAGGILILITCLFLFLKSKSIKKPEDNEITTFLQKFNDKLISGKTDSLYTYFDREQVPAKDLKIFIEAISGKHNFSDIGAPAFKTDFIVDESIIKSINPELLEVIVPIVFSYKDLEIRNSQVIFKIRKTADGQFLITQVNTRRFIPDHIGYEDYVRHSTLTDKDIYSPLTLTAFKKVNELYAKYDTVVWFGHVDRQTYFYVVNGEWNEFTAERDSAKKYKMGLVAPGMKEIIPAQYDLVHNINGTFKGLIEVDKDSKHGFYNLQGELVIPAEYDQVFPVDKIDTLAALRKGNNYYWLTAGNIISDKADIKIDELLSHIRSLNGLTMDNAELGADNTTEVNSRENHASVYIPPSHLVDLGMLPPITYFKNPMRRNVSFYDASDKYNVTLLKSKSKNESFFTAIFQSIRDYFLGGRAEFYDKQNIVLADKKNNMIYSHNIPLNYSEDEGNSLTECKESRVKMMNDTLFEIRTSATVYLNIAGDSTEFLTEAPVYQYLEVKNNKLVELSNSRLFAFASFVKMDDSYLDGCYLYSQLNNNSTKRSDHLNAKYFKYVINEIYAAHNFKFKSKEWTEIFTYGMDGYKPENDNIDDMLTDIEKYNINWLNQKMKESKGGHLAAN